MNLTLSIDEEVAAKARAVATRMGMSLNQLVRNYLAELAADGSANDDIAEMHRLSPGRSGSVPRWRFDRDALHERS